MNTKDQKVKSVYKSLLNMGLHIESYDSERPWGAFFVIDGSDTKKFISLFFNEQKYELLEGNNHLSPKILCVAPNHQLSWQYHQRRAELWKLLEGKAAFKLSLTDEEGPIQLMNFQECLRIECGVRHRLIGLNEWGIIAEIWQHTDENNPSNEDDIVRLTDQYGRK